VIGFAAFFTLAQVTFSHACPEYCEDCPVHPMGLVAFAPLTLHSLVGGLAVAAGSFLYVGATDILPQLHRQQDPGAFALFLAGLGAMLLSATVA